MGAGGYSDVTDGSGGKADAAGVAGAGADADAHADDIATAKSKVAAADETADAAADAAAAELESGVPMLRFLRGVPLEAVNVWWTRGNASSGLHYDAYENVIVQVRGTKRVLLFPPEQSPLLYRRSLPRVG